MSDTHVVPTGTDLLSPEAMGHFDENGVYVPRSITEDDLGGGSLEDAMAGTIVEFEDGDLVEGTVVKIDRDEVLVDVDPDEADAVEELTRTALTRATELSVPLEVAMAWGSSWAEAKG